MDLCVQDEAVQRAQDQVLKRIEKKYREFWDVALTPKDGLERKKRAIVELKAWWAALFLLR